MNIFQLEDGFYYHCSAFDGSQIFTIKDKMLYILHNEKLEQYPIVNLNWFYVELPDQRNKCPQCHRSMEIKPNTMMFANKFYSGLYCKNCKIITEGPDCPKITNIIGVEE
jgi:hypothetical protein